MFVLLVGIWLFICVFYLLSVILTCLGFGLGLLILIYIYLYLFMFILLHLKADAAYSLS